MTEASRNGDDNESLSPEGDAQFSRLYVVGSTQVSPEAQEIARKNEAIILRTCRELTASSVARMMGISDSAVSRWLSAGPMKSAALLLAVLGLKIVPANAVVYIKPEELN